MAVSNESYIEHRVFEKGAGLALKFSIAIVLIIIMMMSLVAIVVHTQVRQTLLTQMQAKGLALTKGLANNAAEALANGDRLLLAELVDKAVKQEEGILQAVLVDTDEKIIVHSSFEKEGQTYKVENKLLYFQNSQIEIFRFFLGNEECLDFVVSMELDTKINSQKIILGKVHLIYSLHAIRRVVRETLQMIVFITLACLGLGIVSALILAGRITSPINKLAQMAEAVSQGDLDSRMQLQSKDELGQLAWTFNYMTDNIKTAQAEVVVKERVLQKLEIAKKIQANLIPEAVPRIKGYTFGMFYQAAEEVGGDYLDFIELDKKHLGMVMADVSGKGIHGALVMTQIRSVFRSLASENFSPVKALTEANGQLYKDMQENMFVAFSYMILDTAKRVVTLSRAGYLTAIIFRKKTNSCYFEKPTGIAIGIADSETFGLILKERKIKLDSGDAVLLYTDGISEACNSENELFGTDRIEHVFVRHAKQSAQVIVNAIQKAVDQFVGTMPQNDDRTMMLMKVEEENDHE